MKLTAEATKGLVLKALPIMLTIAKTMVDDIRQKQLIEKAVAKKVDTIVTATANSVIQNLTQPAELVGKTAEMINNK